MKASETNLEIEKRNEKEKRKIYKNIHKFFKKKI